MLISAVWYHHNSGSSARDSSYKYQLLSQSFSLYLYQFIHINLSIYQFVQIYQAIKRRLKLTLCRILLMQGSW